MVQIGRLRHSGSKFHSTLIAPYFRQNLLHTLYYPKPLRRFLTQGGFFINMPTLDSVNFSGCLSVVIPLCALFFIV